MSSLANTFGAIEIGSAVAVFLFGVITLQAYVYFNDYDDDHIVFRGAIAFIWLLELGLTVTVLYEVYRITIVLFGAPNIDAMSHPALGAIVIIGAFISTTIHIFFSYRLWTIIPKPYNSVAVFIVVAAITRFVITVWTGVKEIQSKVYKIFLEDVQPWILALLAIGAVIDFIIAFGMLWYFLKRRGKSIQRMPRMIDRVIALTSSTGLLTCIVTLSVLILYRTMPHNLIFFAVYASLSKLYTNSLLTTLNARPSRKDGASNPGPAAVSVEVVRKRDRFAPTSHSSSSASPYNNAISIAMKTTTECKNDDSSF
ncbi:hypothetical protein BDN70DRAFT_933052 [Pholiota conissans]|uniref:DUF6534 domain-containing protein n=1 Tax=Pholiota conissans TaxID=109636 RepID=A0A9P6CTV8_9AGAR|nr:hypothetical protein BDN70DRAFT_933052 [Pholiota conissans]